MRPGPRYLVACSLIASACAPTPMTADRAERLCREEADLADGVRGTVGIGVGSGGPRTKAGITITNRIFDPQSEADFIADCVARRMAGRPPPTTAGLTVGGSF